MSKLNSFENLVRKLKEKGLTISAAESCTGGMLAASLVNVPGASQVLEASFVTYSENAKMKIVDVSKESLDKYGVVSEKVALEMAVGAKAKSGSDIGIGITGYAGPAADENDTTAGTVCFGFIFNDKTLTATKYFGDVGRNAVRELSCIYAADTVSRLIKIYGVSDD